MNRTGLIIALAVGAVVGLVFGLYPQLDLAIARPFHGIVDAGHHVFAARFWPRMMLVHLVMLRAGFLLVVPAVVALVVKLILPRRKMLMSGVFLFFSLRSRRADDGG